MLPSQNLSLPKESRVIGQVYTGNQCGNEVTPNQGLRDKQIQTKESTSYGNFKEERFTNGRRSEIKIMVASTMTNTSHFHDIRKARKITRHKTKSRTMLCQRTDSSLNSLFTLL